MALEVAFQVHVHDMHMPAFQQRIHLPQGVPATASGPESVAVRRKLPLEDRFDDHPQCSLHHTVAHGRNAQWPLLRASGLRDHDPFHRLGLVGTFDEVLLHGEQPTLAVFARKRSTVMPSTPQAPALDDTFSQASSSVRSA